MSCQKCREVAWKHFYPEGNGNAKPGYVLHHIDKTLKNENPARYEEWRIEDLVMMTVQEHISLHHTGKYISEEHRKRISEANTGRKLTPEAKEKLISYNRHPFSEERRRKISESNKGKKRSDETRRKISEAQKGRIPWNKGIPMSDDAKEKLRQKKTGQHPTEKTRLRLSEAITKWWTDRKKQ